MKNLCVDIGNSRIKVGRFDNSNLMHQFDLDDHWVEFVLESSINNEIDRILISSVRTLDQGITEEFNKLPNVLLANSEMKFPIDINYESRDTLGVDRIFGAIGAIHRFPDQPVLSIDAGTCITYDIVLPDKGYIGGAISPGIGMRLQAMHSFTGKLPELKFSTSPVTIGTSTSSSMQMGAKEGAIHEMSGMIDSFRKQFDKLQVVLTGGDAFIFEQALENAIFAAPNLVLEGMNSVLLFNKH